MISLRIVGKGPFMSKLLSSDSFDSFLLEEAVIKMAATFSIDGHLNKEFYPGDVWEDSAQRPYDFAPWSEMRSFCHDCIKGKTAPAGFRFTLQLKPEYIAKVLAGLPEQTVSSVKALGINIRLDGTGIHVITIVSMKTFTLDKSAEPIWDKTMQKFLNARGITFEEES